MAAPDIRTEDVSCASNGDTARGYLARTIHAGKGTRLRLWIPALHAYSGVVTVT